MKNYNNNFSPDKGRCLKGRGVQAFTLIELMISILIIVLLSLVAYAPYSFYQKKASLKVSVKQVSQLLSDSKSKAVSWMIGTDKNVSIWVYLEKGTNVVKVFSYPYDINTLDITNIENSNTKLVKELKLKEKIVIDNLSGNNNLLFFFEAVSWDLKYYTFNSGLKTELNLEKINLRVAYQGVNSDSLKKSIEYYTKTNVVFY